MSSTFGFRDPQEQLANAIAIATQFHRKGEPESVEERALHLDRFKAKWSTTIRRKGPLISDVLTDYIRTVFGLETFVRGSYTYSEWSCSWLYIWQPGAGFNMPAVQVWLAEDGQLTMVWPEGGYPEKGKLCDVLRQHTGLAIVHCVNDSFTI